MTFQGEEQKIFSVAELNAFVHAVLEENFAPVWISGEISNLVQPSSGHIYFSLKDQTASVRCVMFRGYNSNLNFKPKNGLHIRVYAQISLYEARGDFQLLIYKMEEAGTGILHEKFLELKEKLAKEGLFDARNKKPIPKMPHCIGVITSPTGAAVRDVLSILKRRFSAIPIIIYPSQVQGSIAALQLADAIKIANVRQECDVLLLTRGGGSIEDLWPFNDETLAREIYASKIPIISAVGHEIDFTIADFVADLRAPTPSAAAELVVPNSEEILTKINHLKSRLIFLMQHKIKYFVLHFKNLFGRLKHPRQIIQQNMQRLDDVSERLFLAIKQLLRIKQHKLQVHMQVLDTLSPLSTLERGYAIVSHNDVILYSVKGVAAGDKINAHLSDGDLQCEILNIVEANNN